MICTESFYIDSKLKHIMLNIMLNSNKKAWSHSTTIHNIGQQPPKKNSSTKRFSDRNSKNIPKTEGNSGIRSLSLRKNEKLFSLLLS